VRRVASALSLLLLLATAFVWLRSYGHSIWLVYRAPEPDGSQRQLSIETWRGSLLISPGFAKGEITEQRVPAFSEGYRQLTPHWRYMWGVIRYQSPRTRLGFARDEHSFFVADPEPVGKYATFVNVHAQQGKSTTYVMPLPIFCVLFAVLPSLSVWIALRRARRIRRGRCPRCCYDLTGNTSGTCSECGTHVPHASSSF